MKQKLEKDIVLGTVSISRATDSTGNSFIVIEVRDEEYSKAVDIKMGLETFAKAVTGHGGLSCVLNIYKDVKEK